MRMKTFAAAYVAALVAFLALDSIWLTLTNQLLYRAVMADMLLDQFRPVPALLFYLIYLLALVYFAVRPGVSQSLTRAILNGALFGFAAYATYDLTNQATLKNWSTTLTLADLAWGSFVSAVGAAAGRWSANRFG
jgi:uncharacterized membrane protein